MTGLARLHHALGCLTIVAAVSTSHAQTCVEDAAPLNSTATTDSTADVAPALATDGNGVWVAVWVENANVLTRRGTLSYARSLDDGITWGARATLPMFGFEISDPHIASDGINTFVIVYEARGGDGNTGVYSRRSVNDGASWSSPVTVDPIANTEYANPRVASDLQSSEFLVTWSSRNSLGNTVGDDADVMIARADFILQPGWSTPQAINANAASDAVFDHDPDIATDGNGGWMVVWSADTCNNIFGSIVCVASDVRAIYSANNGINWYADSLVRADAGAPSIVRPRLATQFVVAYSSDPFGEVDILVQRGSPVLTILNWTAAEPLNPNAPYDAPPANGSDVDVQLAADEDGNLIAVWQSNYVGEGFAGSDSEIFVARSYDEGATWTDQAYMNSTAFTDGTANDAHPAIAVNPNKGRWMMIWESNANIAGTSSDDDILFSSITAPAFYVDLNSPCTNCDGQSWATGYKQLTDAINDAFIAGGGVIRIVQGTYYPREPQFIDPREGNFFLSSCTRIMGGYIGEFFGTSYLRNIDAYETILSGERGGPELTDNFYHVVKGDSQSREVVLSGLTITGGAANNATDPDLGVGGGVFQRGGSIVIEDCTIEGNLARLNGDGFFLEDIEKIFIRNSTLGINNREGGWIAGPEAVYISGIFELNDDLELFDTGIVKGEPLLPGAPGSINLGPNGRIVVNAGVEDGVSPSQSSIFIDQVTGSGTVQLDVGQGFVFNGELDLQGDAPPAATCDDPAAVAQWGSLVVLGEMLLDNALIEHVRISNFDDNEVPADCGTYVGGKLISISSSEIRDCALTVRGDRYFEFDPEEAPSVLTDSCLTVQSFLPPSFGEQGRLFEARSEDVTFVPDPIDPEAYPSGAFPLPSGAPGFNSIWTVDTLEILDDGRMDIVNEEFYSNSPIPEAVYVRDLVLGDNAILNTGFQRVYYETLTMGAGAQIVDIPLLGFSLGVIDFEDECDYDLRVDRGALVERVQIDNGYAMRMSSQLFSTKAKGTFARAEGDTVIVAFDYRFVCETITNNMFLRVYLSDEPGIDNGQTVQVASLRPPQSGRPGSFESDEFAQFHGTFPRGDLTWTRATYVQLEFQADVFPGETACIEIDNFDPEVNCTSTCGDINGDNAYTNRDVLYMLAEIGQAVNGNIRCLDHPISNDIYGDQYDIVLVDGFQGRDAAGSSCNFDVTPPATSPQVPNLPAGTLVIAGKLDSAGTADDVLVPYELISGTSSPTQPAASKPADAGLRGNHRLINGPDGELYQLNVLDGLIRLSDTQVVLGPEELDFMMPDGTAVTVWVHPGADTFGQFEGTVAYDAAFDPNDTNAVFIGPVLVEMGGLTCRYRSVARVDISMTPPLITHLYGTSPEFETSHFPIFGFSCDEFVYEPDRSRIREIEVDNVGNLYVLAVNSLSNNQWLRIWHAASGIELSTVNLDTLSPAVEAPAPMLVTADGNQIYFGTSLTTPAATSTSVWRFDLAPAAPSPLTAGATHQIDDMRFVTCLVEATSSVVAVGYSRDDLPEETSFDNDSAFFTSPRIVSLPANPGTVAAQLLNANGLALPLGAAFAPASDCVAGDTNDDGSVNTDDITSFVDGILNTPSDPDVRIRLDVNTDDVINGHDVATFVQLLLNGGC